MPIDMQQAFLRKRFLTFSGPIAPPATTNLRATLCGMVNEQAKEIVILFSSEGGSVEEGMSLYTYLKALPVDLTMHATGFVKSIAVPVFLAGNKRIAASNAKFLFHSFHWATGIPEIALLEVLEERTKTLRTALDWTKEVVKSTTKLTDSDFESLNLFNEPHILSASACTECGIVSSIGEPEMKAEFDPRVVI